MRRILLATALTFGVLAPALAGHHHNHCNVPLSDWQPREALQAKLVAMGWTITRIKTDDGCYKVYGRNDKGQRYEAKFDPRSLEAIKTKIKED